MQQIFMIEGMTCNGCVAAVHNAIQAVSGVGEVIIDLSEGKATVFFDEEQTSVEKIIEAIEDAGYDATLKS